MRQICVFLIIAKRYNASQRIFNHWITNQKYPKAWVNCAILSFVNHSRDRDTQSKFLVPVCEATATYHRSDEIGTYE